MKGNLINIQNQFVINYINDWGEQDYAQLEDNDQVMLQKYNELVEPLEYKDVEFELISDCVLVNGTLLDVPSAKLINFDNDKRLQNLEECSN